MTVEVLGPDSTSEHANAEHLKRALVSSSQELNHPSVRFAIVPQVFAKNREIDCVLVFEDTRAPHEFFRTSGGVPVRSFVACVEVKNQSPDAVRRHGTHLEVQYNGAWQDATAQAEAQVWALHDLQRYPYKGKARRDKTFVQSVLWLRRVPRGAFNGEAPRGRTRIFFEDLNWQQLIDSFEVNSRQGMVQTLVPTTDACQQHSYDSLLESLTAKIIPTRLDLRRVNELTKQRFDADVQAYVRNLGTGILMFRGRAGTGKTFALIQMAIYLARQGKSTRLVTYNHGLISDMSRALNIIRDRDKDISPVPKLDTRWMLLRELFELTFGHDATARSAKLYELEDREDFFLRAQRNPDAFLKQRVPCCASNAAGKKCDCTGAKTETWGDISFYRRNIPAPYDFLLVDEGQDWSTELRDLMFEVFGAERVIVADGIDQFVNNERCDWDRGDIPKNKIQPLNTSRRTKAATCDTVNDIARALNVPGWDVKPDHSVAGGRVSVLVEANPRRAVERSLLLLEEDLVDQSTMRPVDALVCLPHSAATPGVNYSNLFEAVRDQNQADYWRGYDWEVRQNREYPTRQSALRAVLYQSCRGMEGWTTICMGLDAFYDHLIANPEIDVEGIRDELQAEHGFLLDETAIESSISAAQHAYCLNWLMIPLTRSMDHLVIHVTDESSVLSQVLRRIDRDKISWL